MGSLMLSTAIGTLRFEVNEVELSTHGQRRGRAQDLI
jgi:hypothetical protein